ncbi:MAG: DEAD/DEAH box helicase, partial [Sphingobacteriales bacterium]
KKLVQSPEGIVLITPESLEAMFVNAPYSVKALFSNLKYVVIDEIHSFLGTDRGIHLKSILSRLSKINTSKFCIVGLSATIGDYSEAKKFTGDEDNTKVLLDKASKEMLTRFRYHESETQELPLELLKDLYKQTAQHKVLIFPNSRGRAEEIAVKLKKIAVRVQGHPHYFSHHSSVDKEVREYVEHFAKYNRRQNFCISCTSTLELGIDIGSVDKVVQIDATHSIASLIQRVGRSGRREGQQSELLIYATDKWNLLQSLACWELFKEGYIEPVRNALKPYDLLLHQALSTVKELSGCTKETLIQNLTNNFAFNKIEKAEIQEIIDELVNIDWLEALGRELIIGVEGEYIVNSRDFYSVFKSEQNFKVVNSGNTIGEIPLTPQIQDGENLLLAAKIWKIMYVDFKAKKIEVKPAADGKKPLFYGGGGLIDPRIREKMLEVLTIDTLHTELDQASQEIIDEMRKDFSCFQISIPSHQRPVLAKDEKIILYTFTGTKINRSLVFLLKCLDITHIYDEQSSSFTFSFGSELLPALLEQLLLSLSDIDFYLNQAIQENVSLLDFSKWGTKLPINYKAAILKERYYDFEAAKQFIGGIKLAHSSSASMEMI